MNVLVFVEHAAGEAQRASLGVLSKAAAVFGDVSACVAGHEVRDLAGGLGAYGARRVVVADSPELREPLPQPHVDVLAQLVTEQGFDTVLFGASVLTADVAAGLAARTGGGLNWDLTDLVLDGDRLIGKRPALQDSVVVDCGWKTTPKIALVRSGTFEPVESNGGPAELVDAPVTLEDFSRGAVMVDRELARAEGPSIEEADVIVAGGRGLGSPDQFALVEALAQALGGAVAATRAVVDAGWYPYSTQVGQTGRTVAPKLYVACGISGAIQHKVGMQSSGTIVAINKDRNAPIFDYCDLGVVGDLFDVVPKLTELVRTRNG